jgi:hypothetical protein
MKIIELEKPEMIGEYEFSGKKVGYYRDKGDPIFNSSDVSSILGIRDPYKVTSRLSDKKKMMCFRNSSRGGHVSWFITLDGLVELVYRMRKEDDNSREFVKNIIFETYKYKNKCSK